MKLCNMPVIWHQKFENLDDLAINCYLNDP